MENDPPVKLRIIRQNVADALLGLAGVDHDRPLQLTRRLEVGAENRLLTFRRGEVVVEIEPGLADADDSMPVRVCLPLPAVEGGQSLQVIGGALAGFVRMDAGDEVDVWEFGQQVEPGAGLVERRCHVDDARHAGVASPLEHRADLRGQLVEGQVAVCVNQHGRCKSRNDAPAVLRSAGAPAATPRFEPVL